MRILVTGGAGLVGPHRVDALVAAGHRTQSPPDAVESAARELAARGSTR